MQIFKKYIKLDKISFLLEKPKKDLKPFFSIKRNLISINIDKKNLIIFKPKNERSLHKFSFKNFQSIILSLNILI